MKTRELAIVLVRLFGAWALFQCIFLFEQIPMAFFYPSMGNDAFTRLYAATNMFNAALYLSAGLLSLLKADFVAGLLTRGTDTSVNLDVRISDLAILSFGMAGIFILIDGLEKVMVQIMTYYADPPVGVGRELVERHFNKAIFMAGAMKVVVGLALLISPRGIVKSLRWTRDAGKNRQVKG